ncbi:hypothetical protein ACSBR2_030455 [Camellia fascicularis]
MELHESIELLDKLVHLNLEDCMNLRYLPSSICKLKSVKHLNLTGLCSLTKLNLSDRHLSEGDFPADIRSLSSLRVLDLSGNNFRSLPYGFSHLSKLEDLRLNNCTSLQSISDLPPSLINIDADSSNVV